MSELNAALNELVDELTEHADSMRDLLALVAAEPDKVRRFIPTIKRAVARYDNFIREA